MARKTPDKSISAEVPDHFGRKYYQREDSFALDAAIATWSSRPPQGGLLLTDVNVAYSQQVMRLYEVSSPYVYHVASRPAYNWQLGSTSGSPEATDEFNRTFQPSFSNPPPLRLAPPSPPGTIREDEAWLGSMDGVEISNIALNVRALGPAYQEQLIGMCLSLEFPDDGSSGNRDEL